MQKEHPPTKPQDSQTRMKQYTYYIILYSKFSIIYVSTIVLSID